MTQDNVARFIGAALAAAAVSTWVLTDYEQCGGNGLRGWVQLLLPVLTPIVYSLPRPSLDAYFRNGFAAVLGIATVAAFYGSVADPPSSCELLYAGADGYFIFWGIYSAVILALGAIPFGLLLFSARRLQLPGQQASTD
jgi:hypothetical protein